MHAPDHTIGSTLRLAREAQGLTLDALARELKMPRAVLEAVEANEWTRLGAPVYARHQVGRYAARLAVAVDVEQVAATLRAPELRSTVPVSRFGWLADFSARQAMYVGGTLLVVPLIYALVATLAPSSPGGYRALDPAPSTVAGTPPMPVPGPTADEVVAALPPATPPADASTLASGPTVPAPAGAPAQALTPTAPTPVAAGLAPGLIAAPAGQLELRFRADSWIEVFARDGRVLERGIAREGEARRYATADVGRVTVGNVDGTDVVLDGSGVNLDPVRAANVARFALSSDGSIEAVAR